MEKWKSTSEIDSKLVKHYAEFEGFLKKAKVMFNRRYDAKFEPNASLGDFKRIKTLGTGSFGRVMLVLHLKTKKPYAMKIMEKQHVVKLKQVKHTISEIRILDAVRFEFVVSIDYFFKDNVYLYLSMPFINGGEMFSHLRQMKKFEEPLTKFYAAQVIMCFEYLHYIGIVYRDLKPENILIDREGYLKVTDLGFCKKIDSLRTYTLCGTPEYLAPEIILSKGYNYAVDWWALGVLIFEMAAGFPPFFARDPMRVYEKIVTGKYTCPPHFTKQLKELLSHMLEVDRSKRYGILKNGSKDIKGHEWFKTLDWESVFMRRAKPPFTPKVRNEEDTSNFDFYEEEELRHASVEEFANEFRDIEVTRNVSERHLLDDHDF